MHADPRSVFPADRLGAIHELAPVAGGLSGSEVYSVTTATGEFVLRVQQAGRERRQNAVAMQRLAAAHGIAPEVVWADDARGAWVSVKVRGVPFHAAAAEPATRPALFGNLVETVSRLHAIPLSLTVDPAAERQQLARTIWGAQKERAGFPPWALALETRLGEALAILGVDPRQVFSHCDLHPANVLWDGRRVWLLDWERATLAHPYLDLATFTNFLNLADDSALALVGAQEQGALDERERSVFFAMRDFSRIVYGAAFLSLVPDLTLVDLADRGATPSLGECFAQARAGTLSPATPRGQALIGAALLKLR